MKFFQLNENSERELPGNEDMQTLRYIDFNRTTRQHTRQQADGRRVQDNATLWEWLYNAFEILNMPTIRTQWNQGFIGMITYDAHMTCSNVQHMICMIKSVFSLAGTLVVIIESGFHKQRKY